jgi:hypothetical protein
MKPIRKIIQSVKNKDEAVAGIVVAVMIVGLVLAVVSIIQTVYIPKWMENREAEHMGVVSDQFSQLKFAIDSQIALKENVPICSSITLGSRELGFFMSNKAFGRLSLITDEWGYRLALKSGETFEDTIGGLRYTSENSYFLDQNYIYEIVGVILNQSQGSVFLVKPEFSAVYNLTNHQVNLTWSVIDLRPMDEKTSLNGYGTYPVRTQYESLTDTIKNNVSSFTISTSFPTIWYNFLNTTLSDANLQKNDQYTITKSSSDVTVTFRYFPLSNLNAVIIDLEKIKISTQISPGWIES